MYKMIISRSTRRRDGILQYARLMGWFSELTRPLSGMPDKTSDL